MFEARCLEFKEHFERIAEELETTSLQSKRNAVLICRFFFKNPYSGIPQVYQELAVYLSNAGFSVHILCEGNYSLSQPLDNGITLELIRFKKNHINGHSRWQLALKEWFADNTQHDNSIIIAPNSNLEAYFLLNQEIAGLKFMTMHTDHLNSSGRSRIKSFLLKKDYLFLYANGSNLIALYNSEQSRKHLENLGFKGIMLFLPHAVSKKFQDMRWNDNKLFYFIGAADKRKSPVLLLFAWRALQRKVPNVRAYFLMNGGSLLPLVKFMQKFLRVKGITFFKEIPQKRYIQFFEEGANVIILSRYESFSYVLHQAIAAEKNIVVVRENWNLPYREISNIFTCDRRIRSIRDAMLSAQEHRSAVVSDCTSQDTFFIHDSVARRLLEHIQSLDRTQK
jgi:hypothetical protein